MANLKKHSDPPASSGINRATRRQAAREKPPKVRLSKARTAEEIAREQFRQPPQPMVRRQSVEVSFVGSRVTVVERRPCGHGQTITLGDSARIEIAYEARLIPGEERWRLEEDCHICREVARQAEAVIVEPDEEIGQ